MLYGTLSLAVPLRTSYTIHTHFGYFLFTPQIESKKLSEEKYHIRAMGRTYEADDMVLLAPRVYIYWMREIKTEFKVVGKDTLSLSLCPHRSVHTLRASHIGFYWNRKCSYWVFVVQRLPFLRRYSNRKHATSTDCWLVEVTNKY